MCTDGCVGKTFQTNIKSSKHPPFSSSGSFVNWIAAIQTECHQYTCNKLRPRITMWTILVSIKRQLFLRYGVSNFSNKLVVAFSLFHIPVLPASHHLCNRASIMNNQSLPHRNRVYRVFNQSVPALSARRCGEKLRSVGANMVYSLPNSFRKISTTWGSKYFPLCSRIYFKVSGLLHALR